MRMEWLVVKWLSKNPDAKLRLSYPSTSLQNNGNIMVSMLLTSSAFLYFLNKHPERTGRFQESDLSAEIVYCDGVFLQCSRGLSSI